MSLPDFELKSRQKMVKSRISKCRLGATLVSVRPRK